MSWLNNGLGFGLSTIPLLRNGKTRSISAENPKGEKGAGGKEASHLGVGRKGRPCLYLKQGETATLAEIEGAGVIQHIWITVPAKTNKGFYVLRDLVLRMYWDDEQEPSVEVPLGDFFCNGFGMSCNVNSLPIAVNPTGGMNCYFPMPFRKAARITVENQHPSDVWAFFYQISYVLVDQLPEEAGYFHAQWRRDLNPAKGKDYTILDGVEGKGQYVGTYMAWACLGRYWWGEGEIKFYMDGDDEWPTICGTGAEDYFGGAWGFAEETGGRRIEIPYNTPFLGYPLYSLEDKTTWENISDSIPMHGLYRWHLMDPILFDHDLRVDMQQIGNNGLSLYERDDDISSVAYWYQTEPHAKFIQLLRREDRWPR